MIDGWHYEVFACDLDETAWPAAEMVSLYYGRSEIENRFAQENREMNLNRVFSQSLAGHAFVTMVGMYVWNQRVINGAHIAGLNADSAFAPMVDDAVTLAPKTPEMLVVPSISDVEAATDCSERKTESAARSTSSLVPTSASLDLADLNWPAVMARYPGWSHPADRKLTCPAGKSATLKRRAAGADGTTRLIFVMGNRACRDCPLIRGCTKSKNPDLRKEIMMILSPKSSDSQAPPMPPAPSSSPRSRAANAADQPSSWRPPPTQQIPRQSATSHQPPQLVPSALRRLWRTLRGEIQTRVHIRKAQEPAEKN